MAQGGLANLKEGVEEALADLGIPFHLKQVGEGNNLSPEFAEIVVKLSEEAGHPISRLVAGEEAGWVMEVSSVMRDTGCPHNCLVEGEVRQGLLNLEPDFWCFTALPPRLWLPGWKRQLPKRMKSRTVHLIV